MRASFYVKLSQEQKDRIKDNCCAICGLHRSKWERWRILRNTKACSFKCTDTFNTECFVYWSHLRIKIFKRDNNTCKNCNQQRSNGNLHLDHIIALSLGGSMWDESNLQTLCHGCHRIKTKEDKGKIALYKKQNKHGNLTRYEEKKE